MKDLKKTCKIYQVETLENKILISTYLYFCDCLYTRDFHKKINPRYIRNFEKAPCLPFMTLRLTVRTFRVVKRTTFSSLATENICYFAAFLLTVSKQSGVSVKVDSILDLSTETSSLSKKTSFHSLLIPIIYSLFFLVGTALSYWLS